MPKEKQQDDLTPPSDFFVDAFLHHGSYRWVCDGCGRTHFASSAGFDFESGELEDLLAREKAEPSKYIDHGDESVGVIHLNGGDFVVGCPCNRLKRYEDFIWDSREDIATYLYTRAEDKAKEAKRDLEMAEHAKLAVEGARP